ncbi:MAG: hypothetical protein AB7H88_17790 [Vicinamibacterales bacterium]
MSDPAPVQRDHGRATRQGSRALAVAAGLSTLVVVAACAAIVYLAWPRPPAAEAGRDWTAEWTAQPPVVSTTPGGFLEAARVEMTEDFYRSDLKTWWGIYLGNTVSHIQARAIYRYGVPLVDPAWRIVTRGPVSEVIAPDLRASLPVAIDTGTMREKTENGWARFDKDDQLADLRRSMSAELGERAQDSARLALAREAARRTIGEFVGHWLATQGGWTPGAFSSVNVHFASEADPALVDALSLPR